MVGQLTKNIALTLFENGGELSPKQIKNKLHDKGFRADANSVTNTLWDHAERRTSTPLWVRSDRGKYKSNLRFRSLNPQRNYAFSTI